MMYAGDEFHDGNTMADWDHVLDGIEPIDWDDLDDSDAGYSLWLDRFNEGEV